MITVPIQHFSDDVWLDKGQLHCREREVDLAVIDEVFVNFRVNSAVTFFLCTIFSFFGLGYGYFYYGEKGYLMLIPLVACFGALRYILSNYVELFIVKDGRRERILVAAMRRREWVYCIEDTIKARMHELKSEVGSAE